MTSDDSFPDVFARLQASDDEAATRLYRRFAHRLIALARVRLDQRVRQKLDPEDVVQSVFRSFFGRLHDGKFDLSNWDNLWSLLVVMTVRKCGRKAEFFHGQRRDVRAETAAADQGNAAAEGISRLPTPEEAATLAELVEHLMGYLPEPDRPILELRLQEYTVPEIASKTGRSQRSVERVLQRTRDWLKSQDQHHG